MTFWTAISLLVVLGGAIGYQRMRMHRNRERVDPLTDDMIRQIEEHGRVEVDEPLDLDTIAEEENRFWEETWDEPDEL